MAALLAKMRGLGYYPELFKFAFGSDTITEAGVQTALSAFVRSMVSTNTNGSSKMSLPVGPAIELLDNTAYVANKVANSTQSLIR